MGQKIKQKAFTLIELLVVISIIMLLTSIILVAFNTYRSRARDGQRITDVNRIAAALSTYYNKHSAYPPSVGEGQGTWSGWECGNAVNNSSFQFLPQLVSDGEMQAVPVETYFTAANDGNDNWSTCSYRYMSNINFSPICGITYSNVSAIYARLENTRPTGGQGQQPACLSAWWGEAGSNDPNGYLILLK